MTGHVIDAKGRRIDLRHVTVIDQYRLGKAMANNSANLYVMQMAETAILAAAIDGHPQPFPDKEGQVEALIARLGDEGMAALTNHRLKEIRAVMAAAEAAIAEGSAPDPLAPSAASPSTPDSAASFTS